MQSRITCGRDSNWDLGTQRETPGSFVTVLVYYWVGSGINANVSYGLEETRVLGDLRLRGIGSSRDAVHVGQGLPGFIADTGQSG